MPELLVMRHAKSAWDTDAPTDFDRPLAERGRRDRVRMASWLADEDLCPTHVLSSPALRARSTVEAVIAECRVPAAHIVSDRDLYDADARTWFDRLRSQPESVERLLICGHNPSLDLLVETLCATDPPLSHNGKLMTTAAIAHLRFDRRWADLMPASCDLVTLQRPRDL